MVATPGPGGGTAGLAGSVGSTRVRHAPKPRGLARRSDPTARAADAQPLRAPRRTAARSPLPAPLRAALRGARPGRAQVSTGRSRGETLGPLFAPRQRGPGTRSASSPAAPGASASRRPGPAAPPPPPPASPRRVGTPVPGGAPLPCRRRRRCRYRCAESARSPPAGSGGTDRSRGSWRARVPPASLPGRGGGALWGPHGEGGPRPDPCSPGGHNRPAPRCDRRSPHAAAAANDGDDPANRPRPSQPRRAAPNPGHTHGERRTLAAPRSGCSSNMASALAAPPPPLAPAPPPSAPFPGSRPTAQPRARRERSLRRALLAGARSCSARRPSRRGGRPSFALSAAAARRGRRLRGAAAVRRQQRAACPGDGGRDRREVAPTHVRSPGRQGLTCRDQVPVLNRWSSFSLQDGQCPPLWKQVHTGHSRAPQTRSTVGDRVSQSRAPEKKRAVLGPDPRPLGPSVLACQDAEADRPGGQAARRVEWAGHGKPEEQKHAAQPGGEGVGGGRSTELKQRLTSSPERTGLSKKRGGYCASCQATSQRRGGGGWRVDESHSCTCSGNT